MSLFSRRSASAGGADARPGAAGEAGHTLDASDLDALLRANADFVWRSVRCLGVPEAAADDATQQVFVIAQKKITSIVAGRERAFLCGVAINVAAHWRRTVARRREVLGEDETQIADPRPSPDVALDTMRARALLDEVLDAMEIDLRTVFVLCELEEMTMADVAELLTVPPGTVASRLRRARESFHAHAQRLRARLERGVPIRAASVPELAVGQAAGSGR